MNTVEAMQALIDGKKVRRTCWPKDNYVVVSGGCVVTESGFKANLACDGEWEVYLSPFETSRRCFTDLEGKIPAQVGDLVALIITDQGYELRQEVVTLRPRLFEGGWIGGDTKAEYLEGTPK